MHPPHSQAQLGKEDKQKYHLHSPYANSGWKVRCSVSLTLSLYFSKAHKTFLSPPSSLHLHLHVHEPILALFYVLILSLGRFHEVFRGNGVTHRLARLQPDTKYTLKIAATSESGQGVWSDHVTFSTAPSPPPAPTG